MNTAIPLPQKLRYGLQLLRIKDWSVQNGVFLLGAFFADDFLGRTWGFIIMSLALSCLCLAYGYSLNEFFDEIKEKVAGDAITTREMVRCICAFLIFSLGVAWMISTTTFVIVALLAVTVWLHSAPPFVLKRRLFWRLFLNSLGFGLFFLAGSSLDNHVSTAEALMGVFIFGLYLPLELIHVLAHMEADRIKGFPTLALVQGEKKTMLLAVVLLGCLIGYSGLLAWLGVISPVLATWSVINLLLLLGSLVAFYKRNNSCEVYTQLRFRAKIVCAIYGVGMLSILVGKA